MTTTNRAGYEGMVLLFNTCADSSRAARLHAASCSMVNTSKRGRKVVAVTDPKAIAEDVDDLNERGFPVKRCKCCKENA